ncbi:MAG: GNAT family N-acetyltransferase [Devosia sp.]|nr:GNAT family N-acetyltransferase [Devosia sp.]
MPELIRWRQIAEPADPGKISELVAATGVFSEEEVRVAGELATTTLDGTETYRFMFAEQPGGALKGFACFDRIALSEVSFDLYWIAVAPSEQGTGLAQELMRRTAAFAKSKRGLWLFAETSSREPYARARAFYRRAGFEEAARFDDFYAVGDAKVIFRLKL